MAGCTLKASEEVLNLLNTAAVIGDDGVTLGKALSRTEYVAVNKFLETAGAKWNKKAKRHLFAAPDARKKLLALLETGEIRDDKRHFQAFYTPSDVARQLVEIADIQQDMLCLEPSVGHGAIYEAIREAEPNIRGVVAIDANPDVVPVLKSKGLGAMTADFLDCDPEDFARFDRVVMNPPFTGDQDIKHVRHAYRFLREGGKLVAIMSPGFTFGESHIRREFREFVEEHGRVVEELPEGSFKESGTNVRAVVVELVK